MIAHSQSSTSCSRLPQTQQSLRTERLTTARRAKFHTRNTDRVEASPDASTHYPTQPVNNVMQNARYPHRHALRSSLGTRGGHRLRLAAVPTTLGGVMISGDDHLLFQLVFPFGFCALFFRTSLREKGVAHGSRRALIRRPSLGERSLGGSQILRRSTGVMTALDLPLEKSTYGSGDCRHAFDDIATPVDVCAACACAQVSV